MHFPCLNYPSNILPREKSDFSIRLWQKLCICYSFIELPKRLDSLRSKFPSLFVGANYYQELIKNIASELIDYYSDIIPEGIAVEDLLSEKSPSEGGKELDLYEFEFHRIRSILSSSYIMRLWEKVKSDMNTENLDELLFEFRKRLSNHQRRQKLSSKMKNSWYPSEWLCFITYGIQPEMRRLIISTQYNLKEYLSTIVKTTDSVNRNDSTNSEKDKQNPPKYVSKADYDIESVRIQNFPYLNYLYNTLPRLLSKKTHKMWQYLCVSYAMLEYLRYKETSLLSSIDKMEYLEQAYYHYTQKILMHYSNEIPTTLTVDMLCQIKLDSMQNSRQARIDGYIIQRIWTTIVSQINCAALSAWEEEILPVYCAEDFSSSTTLPIILSTLRRTWWDFDRKRTRLEKKKGPEIFDPDWFPAQWLIFICFGPISKISYFKNRTNSNSNSFISKTAQTLHEQRSTSDRLNSLISSYFPTELNENSESSPYHVKRQFSTFEEQTLPSLQKDLSGESFDRDSVHSSQAKRPKRFPEFHNICPNGHCNDSADQTPYKHLSIKDISSFEYQILNVTLAEQAILSDRLHLESEEEKMLKIFDLIEDLNRSYFFFQNAQPVLHQPILPPSKLDESFYLHWLATWINSLEAIKI